MDSAVSPQPTRQCNRRTAAPRPNPAMAERMTFGIVGFDDAVRSWVLAHQWRTLSSASTWISAVGSVTPMVEYAILGALVLWRRGSRRVISAVLLAPGAAVATYVGLKQIVERARPSVAGLLEGTSSFPSAHATTSSAICCTLAYVFWKEKQASGLSAGLFAAGVPFLVGASRVYLDLHWATDVLGGWAAGLLIGVLCAVVYQRVHKRRRYTRVRNGWRHGVVVGTMSLSASMHAHAQPASSPTPSGVLITSHDISLIAGALAASAALSRFDIPIAHTFNDSGFHARHPSFVVAAKRASLATETLLMVTGGTAYGIARLRHNEDGAAIALHATESVASAAIVIQVFRGALGRARPYVIDEAGEKKDSDPYEFELLHGFSSYNYRSFPSMHAMASMAIASALAQEMRFHDTPNRRLFAPMLYGAAVLPSLGRLYLDEHWGSDIVMGMFLGIFAGQKVVMYSRDHSDNRVDRDFLEPSVRATVVRDARGFSFHISPF